PLLRLPARQPIITLVPYTTLFRSVQSLGRPDADQRLSCAHGRDRREGQENQTSGHLDAAGPVRRCAGGRPRIRTQGGTAGVAGKDRKSTRLNSSHGSISYAVFCLK